MKCSKCGAEIADEKGVCKNCGLNQCPKCKAACASSDKFCSQCGFTLNFSEPTKSQIQVPKAPSAPEAIPHGPPKLPPLAVPEAIPPAPPKLPTAPVPAPTPPAPPKLPMPFVPEAIPPAPPKLPPPPVPTATPPPPSRTEKPVEFPKIPLQAEPIERGTATPNPDAGQSLPDFSELRQNIVITNTSAERRSFRKHVTVLAVDLKGSTELIQKMDPEEAKEVLFPAITVLSNIVTQHGGVVIFTAGDGLIAIFGAPKALEDHPLRACIASEEMHQQIKKLNLVVRIGLHSGEVLIEEAGGRLDIVGAVVNLAARMQQSASPGTTRLTRQTLSLVSDSVIVNKMENQTLKGFDEPIEIYELVKVKVSKSLSELERQFLERTGFVNRAEEIQKVKVLLEQAKQGQGNIVSICAESGMGKSRIIFEIINSDSARDCNILLTAGFIHTKDVPLLPITNLFRGIFKIVPGDNNLEEIKGKIQPYLTKIDFPYALNAILSLINIPINDVEWANIEPAIKRKYAFEIGAKVLLSFAAEKPLIFIIEDLHWIDIETELFIDLIMSSIKGTKLFLFLNYRPEYYDHWTNKPYYTKIELEPLNNEFGEVMLQNILGDDPSLKELKQKFLSVVEGNPFFLEELTLSLIAKGTLIGERGKYKLKESTIVKELQLPESVATIYQSKIDNLAPMEKKIIQIASVIGSKFNYSQVLKLLSPTNEREIRQTLDKLCRDQYLYEAQLYPEPIYGFLHAITIEIAYNSILKKTRKLLHKQILEILEAQGGHDKQVDQLQIMAEHAYLAEQWDKALEYSYYAAKKVYEISAFSTSARLFERALIAASHYPKSEELSRFVMQIHYELYYTYVPIGKFKEQEEHLERALEIAQQIHDRFFESIVYSAYAIFYCGFKDALKGLEFAKHGYQIAKEINSLDALVISQFTQVHVYLFVGNLKEQWAIHEEMESMAPSLEFRSDWLRAPMGHIALCYTLWGRSISGDFATVKSKKGAWFATSKNLDEPSIPNMCRYSAMAINEFLSFGEDALEYAAKAYKESQDTEVIIFVPIFAALIAEIYIRMGKIEEAKPFLQHAAYIVDRIQGSFTAIFAYFTITQCYLLLGELEQARAICETGMQIAKARNTITFYKMLQNLWCDIHLCFPAPNFEEILSKLQDSLKEFEDKGLLPVVANCHLSFAKLYMMMGKTDKQELEMKRAKEIFNQLGIKRDDV